MIVTPHTFPKLAREVKLFIKSFDYVILNMNFYAKIGSLCLDFKIMLVDLLTADAS